MTGRQNPPLDQLLPRLQFVLVGFSCGQPRDIAEHHQGDGQTELRGRTDSAAGQGASDSKEASRCRLMKPTRFDFWWRDEERGLAVLAISDHLDCNHAPGE